MSRDKLMKKDRRHSIFDDKNRAILGELVIIVKSNHQANNSFFVLSSSIHI
jgi:hypothetical protein